MTRHLLCRYFLPLGQYPCFLSVVEQAKVLGRYICWLGDVNARQHCLLHDARRPGPCVVPARLTFVILRDVVWPCAGGPVLSLVRCSALDNLQSATTSHYATIIRCWSDLHPWSGHGLLGRWFVFHPWNWYCSTGTRVSAVLVPLLFCFCSFRF